MPRRWTLETAQALFPEVRERTAKAVAEAEPLMEERQAAPPGSEALQALEKRIQAIVSRWAREMEALGCEVKGAWLVDFDTGGGYYCWKWPEERLAYFHGYEEGFAGRTPIQ